MSILPNFLKKRGVNSPSELTKEERVIYEEYQSILSKEELTTGDIRNFCKSQIEVIEGKWSDLNVSQERKSELLPYHTVYRLLLTAIDAPKSAKESLEKHLNQLIQ